MYFSPLAADGYAVTTLKLGEPISITGASQAFTPGNNRLSDAYYKSYAPYVSVYRFEVKPGVCYTLTTEYSGDGEFANVELVGANPLSTKLEMPSQPGSMSNLFGFTGSTDKVMPQFTYRNNFSIAKNSSGKYLYVIGHFATTKSTLKVTLQTPALSDSEVEKSLEGGRIWGTAFDTPLYTFNLESSVPGNIPLKTVIFTIGQNTALSGGIKQNLDLAPYKSGTRTMVPLRYIGGQLGANVLYDAGKRQVTYTTNTVTLELWLGKRDARVNGIVVQLEAPPESINGRLAVPLRFIGENLGASVLFDAKTQRITINQY